VNSRLEQVVSEVEEQCRNRSVYMLGPRKARFLHSRIVEHKPGTVLECGTAIGYSGLHIAAGLERNGSGKLITIENDPVRANEAEENFRRAGVTNLVRVLRGDGAEVIRTSVAPDLSARGELVDFLFLDNGFDNYFSCFQAARPVLADGAVLAADNAGIGAASMSDYLEHVRSRYQSTLHWFDTDLPWSQRDAIEVTIFRRGD
jgi:predicted O-methyltransferase YrrM